MEIRDPLARKLGLEISEVREDGLVTIAHARPEVLNPYGMAHGGYLHALGQLSAAAAAEHRSASPMHQPSGNVLKWSMPMRKSHRIRLIISMLMRPPLCRGIFQKQQRSVNFSEKKHLRSAV